GAGLPEQLAQAVRIAGDQARSAAGPAGLVRDPAADPEPACRLLEQLVGDQEREGERQAELVTVHDPERDLALEPRSGVLGERELHERKHIISAEQLPDRRATGVAYRRGEM